MKQKCPPVTVTCPDCKQSKEFPPWRAKKFVRCKPCAEREKWKTYSPEIQTERQRLISDGRKEWQKNNPERCSEIGKYARSKVTLDGKELRKRQQNTIERDSEYYKGYCEKRRRIALDFHQKLEQDETAKKAHYAKVFKASKAEDEFFIYLERNEGLFFERQHIVSGFFVDGWFKDTKLIIEFYGDAHHCNPKKFQNPDLFCSWIGRTVGEQWKYDERRLAALYKNGYEVVIVWYSDWITDRENQVKRIKNALSKS